MLIYHDGPSVTIEDGHEWAIYTAKIDTNVILHEFPELDVTPDEAATIVEQMLDRVRDEMYDHMPEWVAEIRR